MAGVFGRQVVRALLLLVAAAPWAFGEGLQFEHLLNDESAELQDNISTVNSIEQDARGFIWIGGENGLARYDGHQVVFYHAGPPGSGRLSGNYIRGIVNDKNGVLWVATLTGLNRYDADLDHFETYRHDDKNPQSLPNDALSALAVDGNNNLWFGTAEGVGVLDAQRRHFRQFRHDANNPASLSDDKIRPLMVDSRNRLWIGTTEGGLNRVDHLPRAGEPLEVVRYLPQDKNPQALSLKTVTALAEDRHGRIWIGTHGGGISRLEADLKSFRQYQPSTHNLNALGSNTIWAIKEDRQGQVWIACDKGGLIRYQETTDSFTADLHSDTNSRSLSTNTTRALAEDREGDLWIGNFPSGVNYFNRATAIFNNFSHQQSDPNSLSNKSVVSFLQDSSGDIWVGTEDGLNRFNPITGQFKRYVKDLKNPKALQASAIISLAEGANGDIWVGTWSAGLFRFDKRTEEFHQYRATGEPGALNCNYIWHLVYDRQHRLWVGTQTGGLNLYIPETDSFKHYPADPQNPQAISANFIWNMLEDTQGRLWLGTEVGLDLFNPATETFRHFKLNNPNSAQNNNLVLELMQHSSGDIWLGTQDKGVAIFNPTTETFRYISTPQGLSSPWVTSMVEDNDHNVWVATFNGLSRIDGHTSAIKTFGKSQGLVANNFNRDASLKDQQGNIYVGGTEGFSRFDPRAIVSQPIHQQPVFTGFWVQDLPVPVPKAQAPLQLPYNQNSLAIKFSAMSFRAAHKNVYQFKMEGFDRDWSTPKAMNQASYTNLNPGRYVFWVRAANSDGVWNEQAISLPVTILPPPWRSWWAYSIYALLAAGFVAVCGLAVYAQLRARRLELANEKALTLKLRKLDKMKDAFLANTSHELRTPLNGIIGLAESLLDNSGHGDPMDRQSLRMIVASGKRLAHLVSDILDCAKLAERQLRLDKKPVDLWACTDAIMGLLQPLAEQKKLQFCNKVAVAAPPVWADEHRLQQILFNLIGNALKYTSTGGVVVSAETQAAGVRIEVSDTGVGIPNEELDSIFIAFTQVEDSDTRSGSGTGLGLAITKQLVELHGGSLLVCSQVGQGTQFSFTLPLAPDVEVVASKEVVPVRLELEAQEAAKPALHPLVLVVDDDPVNRMVVARLLAKEPLRLLDACSGEEALGLLAQHPDIALVLLDIMMPQLSGYETCAILRKTYRVDQLPVIFLTAKDQDDDRVRCLTMGGNDFLTKPVAKPLLVKQIHNWLNGPAAEPGYKVIRQWLLEMKTFSEPMVLAEICEQRLRDSLPQIQYAQLWTAETGGFVEIRSRRFIPLSEALAQTLNRADQDGGYVGFEPGSGLEGFDGLMTVYFEECLVGLISWQNAPGEDDGLIQPLKAFKPLLVACLLQMTAKPLAA